jgi:hypothetical protein
MASPEIRQNNGGQVRLQGMATFAEALGMSVAPAAQKIAAPVLHGLQRKGQCGKEAFSTDLIFWVTFCIKTKSDLPPRQ